MKLTNPQKRVLSIAVEDGGAIETGAVEDGRQGRNDGLVAFRLSERGLLKWRSTKELLGCVYVTTYEITDAGRDALASQ